MKWGRQDTLGWSFCIMAKDLFIRMVCRDWLKSFWSHWAAERRCAQEVWQTEGVREFLSERFARYLESEDMKDAIEGFVQTENEPELRKELILKRMCEIATLGNSEASFQ